MVHADPARGKDRRRIVGVDVARCLALVGMMATHMLPGYVEGEVPWPQQLAGGRASALFAVLAGVSIALMTGRRRPPRGRDRAVVSAGLAVRALVIAALGLLLGDLRSGLAVILTYYGVLFLLGLPFLGLRSGALFGWAAGWLAVVPVLSHLLRPVLPEPSLDNPSFSSLADPWLLLTELTFTGYYPTVPWLVYLLVGMAVGRLDLRRPRTALLLACGGAVLAAVAWAVSRRLTSLPAAVDALRATYDRDLAPSDAGLRAVLEHGLFGTTPTESWWWITVAAPHTATPFDLAQTTGSALLVLGLALLASRALPRLWAVALGAGAMTLTLYGTHVVMRTAQVWPSPDHGLDVYRTHLLVVLGAGAVFALLRRRGPLEALTALFAGMAAATVRLVVGGPRYGSSTNSDRKARDVGESVR